MTGETSAAPSLIMYMEQGSRRPVTPEQLQHLVADAASWLNYLAHSLGGAPARMTVSMGDRREKIFVVRQKLARHGDTFADLASRYPEA